MIQDLHETVFSLEMVRTTEKAYREMSMPNANYTAGY
jgi:hypothetical protein